jgi:lysophospholipase L1-like esterase
MKSALKNALLLLGALIFCLICLEAFTRVVLDDGKVYELEMWKYARQIKMRDAKHDIGHRHRPGAEATLMGVAVRTNSFGFRGAEIPEKAGAGVARIAFVGDSITLGWGVAEQETFASQVLESLHRQGRKMEGFNLGVGNFNTSQELALFRDAGERMKPDIIVLSFTLNDAEPMPRYASDNWLARHSAAWVVLSYRVDSLLRQFGQAPDWKKHHRQLFAPDAEGWREAQRALRGFAEESRQLGAELIVFNIPELRQLKPYPFADIAAAVLTTVEEQKVRFVDLLPTVKDLEPSSLWVTVPDPHPNAKAHAAFARGITAEIDAALDRLCRSQQKGC